MQRSCTVSYHKAAGQTEHCYCKVGTKQEGPPPKCRLNAVFCAWACNSPGNLMPSLTKKTGKLLPTCKSQVTISNSCTTHLQLVIAACHTALTEAGCCSACVTELHALHCCWHHESFTDLRRTPEHSVRAVLHDALLHVLTHQVPVAFAGVKLDCKPARVPQGLGRTPLMDDSAETHDHRGLHTRGAEDVRTSQVGDVVGDLQAKEGLLELCRRRTG